MAAHDHDRVRARHSLALVHPQATRLPSGTQAWLARRQLDSYHHARLAGLAGIVMRTLLLVSAHRTALVERDADLVLKPPRTLMASWSSRKSTLSSR